MNQNRYALAVPGIATLLLLAQPSIARAGQTDLSPGSTLDRSPSKSSVTRDVNRENASGRDRSPDAGRSPGRSVAQNPGSPLVPNPEIIIQGNPRSPASSNPTLPRAVAPPIGDIAISNIDASADRVKFANDRNLNIPRLLLRQASVREVLMTLANYAGYNVVFTGAQGEANATAQTVSLEFANESVENIFNSVLLISGLQGNIQGQTIYVGARLPQGARNLISRTLRLNQVKANNAATFLATQGAEFQRLVSKTEDIVDPLTGRVIGRREIPSTLESLAPQNTEGAKAPLLLTGLRVAADDRLNSITLIGETRLVQVATTLLTQLDARRRQVVVNVKVIDVNLKNTDTFNSSFIFGFVNGYAGQINGNLNVRIGNPADNNLFSSFEMALDAQIASGNAKILTDPSLVVQEGQQATVKLTEKVLESVNTQVDPLSGVRTTTPVLADAGLTLAVNVDQIDDNGYINLSVSPTIAAPGTSFLFDSGQGTVNRLTPLIRRELTSGLVRLRDGQTLVLSGVIQETDRVNETKVPILGDIPILGALFRSRNNEIGRSEVIILLSPKILEDNASSTVGLDFQPSPEAVEMMQRQGFPVQPGK
ncbi:type II and III secretion system protein [Pannus brasiliensis CCIBt3594]|uniref:Type II and III secretion system protein n=1 Tax=Pannus brasiliensis CCIBt3594 TaxID=1427578 RepID=A0AAW9QP45_9CHRO